MRIYIDTSAYVKYYGNPVFEKGTSEIEKVIIGIGEGKHILFSSYWLLPEVTGTVDSWHRKRYISTREKAVIYARILTDVTGWSEKGHLIFTGVPHENLLSAEFLNLISRQHLSPGDALHIYTAKLVEPHILATADSGQIRVAKQIGIETFNPESQRWTFQ